MRILLLLPFLLLHTSLYSQSGNDEIRILHDQFLHAEKSKEIRVANYLKNSTDPKIFKDLEGNLIEMVDIDPFGNPVYISTLNAGLALSTGVTALRGSGSLGVNLLGNGITIGIWDGGAVFQHVEFGERLLTVESGAVSDHGTHVAGTVAASGLNLSAMGMAPSVQFHSYDWNNDNSEMIALATADESGLLFSNHSYGLIQGWFFNGSSWQWSGNTSISTTEDWRFGFYTSEARDLDQITFNAPYYSIFWAAGNDRDDVGLNGAPQDGNMGSGYDCLGQEGTAKNIFTIGAIRKFTNYSSPSIVEMSGFSSWGPTDDGRIKPDLVAPGVSILSTTPNNLYGNSSGTSMASPGAMGSLVLVQELHKNLNAGRPMRSATLKALAIHTAKEAGSFPGPDYSFGWGVVDVEAASKLLLSKDDQNVFVQEIVLSNGQTKEFMLTPKPGTKITATIAWTDPAGNISPASLDPKDKKLVNDLDLRLLNDGNDIQFPWALDPSDNALGQAAFKADNSLDNVEKLEFLNAEPRSYRLTVSHKGTLSGGEQAFSLVVEYQSTTDPLKKLFWVNGSGSWNDPLHWSEVSGGIGGAGIPDVSTNVVFDENSLVDENEVILASNERIGSLTWLNRSTSFLDFSSHDLFIEGNLILGNEKVSFTGEGRIIFDGINNEGSLLQFSGNKLEQIDVVLSAQKKFELSGECTLKGIELTLGDLSIKSEGLKVNSISTSSLATQIVIDNATINDLKNFKLENNVDFSSINANLHFGSSAEVDFSSNDFDGIVYIDSPGVEFFGNSKINSLVSSSEFILKGSNEFEMLELKGGSTMILESGSEQILTQNTFFRSSAAKRVNIHSSDVNKAKLKFVERSKICFDFLDIEGVEVTGEGVVNAGASSTLLNAPNWVKDACENILFPDFQVVNDCAGGLMIFEDKSEGLILSRSWSSLEEVDFFTPEEEVSYGTISEPGSFPIRLTIQNSVDSRYVEQQFIVKENTLSPNAIIINGLNLFSQQVGGSYQWFKDYRPINGANLRSYPFNGEEGFYFVVTIGEGCNRISSPLVISEVSKEEQGVVNSLVWPNPTDDVIYFNDQQVTLYKIVSLAGNEIQSYKRVENGTASIAGYTSGVYIIELVLKNNKVVRQKLVIK